MKLTNVCDSYLVTFLSIFAVKQVVTFPRCTKSHPTPNSTVHFVNKNDLVPEVTGCIMQYLSFRFCMADYVAVRWYQQMKNGSWEDFLHTTIERELDDDNQTAILKSPWDHGFDNGTYKCVGNGIKPGDAIEHSVTVNLKECPDLKNSSPIPFLPDKEESKRSMKLSTNVSVMCGAIFGTECNMALARPDCTFQWEKIGKHGRKIPAGNSTSGLRLYYENSGTASNVYDLTSTLYIIDSVESDYGTYVCSMENKFGKADRKITLTKRDVILNPLLNNVVIGIIIAVVVVSIVLIVVSCRFKWHVLIRWNELKHRIVPFHGGKLQHDILLLHTSSVTVDASFARYCKQKLEQLGYSVIFEDDITGGQNTISEWLKRSDESQCVIIILSPDFLTDEDETCHLPLRNIIQTKANFLFVLFRFTLEKPTTIQMRHIEAAIQIKPNVYWSVDTSIDVKSESEWEQSTSADEVGAFWEQLTSYLPQPLQTETGAALESDGCNSEVSALLSDKAGRPVAPESA